ncbi:3-hydroxyacyl-CoA dehydrogenase/enoyl-CoA hydratase family protein [Alicyclobacillus acidiphilus]|uniref:3-hydroxyacyl-CoA dehydrogenase/enoyl-CoA hydratase family protein n=1 Tax=Alicyclobacillus acidiphilus TaxID=182455 RepID=UPI000830EB5D|nr:3-hydroxyacyl-CoA dehydrogenase/enoyl-CoA hydratase family protein [Alicyclobacillus acidiphilus]
MRQIQRAAVIGSGVMGASIAAHLAGVGIPCLLLDLVPDALTPEEQAKGLSLEHPAVRNRLATEAVNRLKKLSPAPLYDERFAERITPGNIEDHLGQIATVDWVIEVIVERLEPKRQLLERIESHWRPGIIVSSNTSGISIEEMSLGRSDAFRQHFLGTHFFNPPRYMKLLEVIPGSQTLPEIVEYMVDFGTRRLGKGVVIAKDTPNFIANRIGTFGLLATFDEMTKGGYTVEEVDAVTGPALGRPKSATFRTLDLVGIDTFVHVAGNVREKVEDKAEKAIFEVPEPILDMVSRNWIGEKAGQGFYRKVKGEGGSVILALDLETMAYREQQRPTSASLEAAKQAKGPAAKSRALIGGQDRYAQFAWNLVKRTLVYSAEKVGEIADSIEAVDLAMKWGFNWDLGPFELWDAIGLRKSVERMQQEGLAVPAWVLDWLAAGHESFYEEQDGKVFIPVGPGGSGTERKQLVPRPNVVDLRSYKKAGRVVEENTGASLIDLGDGVACLEFHSQNNAIGPDILAMIDRSIARVKSDFAGLVIANQARNFCVGANLMLILMAAQEGEWDEIDEMIHLFQNTMMKLKYAGIPTVAAPHRMTLGGGVEICLAADVVMPAAETYFGLVEVGVGVIPAGGGCKEAVLRAAASLNEGEDIQPKLNALFETIGMAKVSTSGHHALRMGLLRSTDEVVVNGDLQIHAAKERVLRMVDEGYTPRTSEAKVAVAGEDGAAVLKLGVRGMLESGYISDHDFLIASKLANALAGGQVPAGTVVTERYLLELEREAFLSLCGEPKTQARMQHMLLKGKPLRN